MRKHNNPALIISLLLTLAFFACKKPENNELATFRILESVTSIPIADVKVDAYTCSTHDFFGNYLSLGAMAGVTTTNAEGKAFFPKSLSVGGLKIQKNKYWESENMNPGFSP